jgi:hypothetical protein
MREGVDDGTDGELTLLAAGFRKRRLSEERRFLPNAP